MSEKPIDTINDMLGIRGAVTLAKKEVKCWLYDAEDGGVHKAYLDAEACRALSRAFADMAETLEGGE